LRIDVETLTIRPPFGWAPIAIGGASVEYILAGFCLICEVNLLHLQAQPAGDSPTAAKPTAERCFNRTASG